MSDQPTQHYKDERARAVAHGVRTLYRDSSEDPERRERFDRTIGLMMDYFLPRWRELHGDGLIDRVHGTQAGSAFDQRWFIHGERFDGLEQGAEFILPEGETEALFERPTIFCAFHLNSYRMIWPLLLSRISGNLFYTLAEHVIQDHDPEVEGRLRQRASERQLNIVPAESPLVVKMAVDALRAGDSMLAYVDGNTGVGGKRRFDQQLLRVPFLNGTIRVRRGLAVTSHLVNVPIRPLFAEIAEDGRQKFRVLPAIRPRGDEPRNAYVARAMHEIYGVLASYVRRHPASWTEWSTLHIATVADRSGDDAAGAATASGADPLRFNHERFELLPFAFGDVLVDRDTLRFFPVRPEQKVHIRTLYEQRDTNDALAPELETGLTGLERIGALCRTVHATRPSTL